MLGEHYGPGLKPSILQVPTTTSLVLRQRLLQSATLDWVLAAPIGIYGGFPASH